MRAAGRPGTATGAPLTSPGIRCPGSCPGATVAAELGEEVGTATQDEPMPLGLQVAGWPGGQVQGGLE